MADLGLHTSWTTLREQLRTHQVITAVLPTTDSHLLKFRRATTPEPQHQLIYRTLDIPEEAMAPIKTWLIVQETVSDESLQQTHNFLAGFSGKP